MNLEFDLRECHGVFVYCNGRCVNCNRNYYLTDIKDVEIGDKDKFVIDTDNTGFNLGYNFALKEINTPMRMITKKWNPSECPRCHIDFGDLEECDDGYYNRATNLNRCPYCGQSIEWN